MSECTPRMATQAASTASLRRRPTRLSWQRQADVQQEPSFSLAGVARETVNHVRSAHGTVRGHVSKARAGMKRAVLTKMQSLVDKRMGSVYLQSIKPGLTADRRVPWLLRVATHDLVDEVWENVRVEVRELLSIHLFWW